MEPPQDGVMLRVFLGEDDKVDQLPLYEAIVLKAREMHLAGATVFRAPDGFGHSGLLHATMALGPSQDLPLVIEIVDSQEKIEAFLPVLSGMMRDGMITQERVRVLKCGPT